jgi:hypothetical protein
VPLDLGSNSITAVALATAGDLWLGTSQGLYHAPGNSTTLSFVQQVPAVPIRALALHENPQISNPQQQVPEVAVGTDLKLWRLLGGTLWHFWYTNSNIDYNITALGFEPDGSLWIGNRDAVNVQTPNLQLHRIGGYELPYGNITAIPQLTGGPRQGVWLGTKWGLLRFDGTNRTGWRYLNGPRWLPATTADAAQGEILAVAVLQTADGSEQVLVANGQGLARISIEWWTLAQKANYMQGLVYPRHDRYGLTADCGLATFGNLSSYYLTPSDNDGLWTEIYLASQSYRFAVTSSQDAYNNSLHAWNAMHFLQQVTGLPGYPARSFGRYGDPGTTYNPNSGQHTWFNSTTYPGWVYLSDTSSDEIVGHQYGLPIFADLVAGRAGIQPAAIALFTNITDWILANNYTLISPLGEQTTWGFWDPTRLNDTPDDYDERGLNSLQILAWLQSAYHHTGNTAYLDAFSTLVNRYGYGINIINQKVTVPNDDNFSDDELGWLSWGAWLNVDSNPAFPPFWPGLNRTIDINAPEKSALWNLLYLTATSTPSAINQQLLQDAIWCLQTWPLEQIEWPVQNSQRFDLLWRYYEDRQSNPTSANLLRYDEGTCLRWNCDPYETEGGSGYGEEDPSAWLLPYWIARYYLLLI